MYLYNISFTVEISTNRDVPFLKPAAVTTSPVGSATADAVGAPTVAIRGGVLGAYYFLETLQLLLLFLMKLLMMLMLLLLQWQITNFAALSFTKQRHVHPVVPHLGESFQGILRGAEVNTPELFQFVQVSCISKPNKI